MRTYMYTKGLYSTPTDMIIRQNIPDPANRSSNTNSMNPSYAASLIRLIH